MHTVLTVVVLVLAGSVLAVGFLALGTPALIRWSEARAAKRAQESAPSPIDSKEATQ